MSRKWVFCRREPRTSPPRDTCREEMGQTQAMPSPLGHVWLAAITLLKGKELTVQAQAERGAGWPNLQIDCGPDLCEAPLGNACLPLCTVPSLASSGGTSAFVSEMNGHNFANLLGSIHALTGGGTSPWAATACQRKERAGLVWAQWAGVLLAGHTRLSQLWVRGEMLQSRLGP